MRDFGRNLSLPQDDVAKERTRMSSHRTVAALALVVIPVGLLVGCGDGGSSASSTSSKPTFSSVPTSDVKVQATGSACQLSSSTLTAGKVTVTATSSAGSETEVYLYGQENGKYTKVMGEVEGLTSGLTKAFSADVPAGTYELVCKSDGKELRVPVTAK